VAFFRILDIESLCPKTMNLPEDHQSEMSEMDRLLTSLEQHYQQNPTDGPEIHFGILTAFVNGTMTDPHEREVVNRAIEAWHHWSEAHSAIRAKLSGLK
jgi:hypothetical protein